MMFNGTKKFGPEVFDRTLEAKGCASNAFTTEDLTAYYETVPSEALETVVDLEADRMAGLALTDDSLAKEREVVKEERRLTTDNDLEGSLFELLQGMAFLAHPYRWPVVGWMTDLDAIGVKDCEDYFRVHYAPNNATVIVVGDFKPDRLIALISKAYAPIGAQPAAPAVVRDEPEQQGERRAVLRRAAQLPAIAVAYHVPASSSDEIYPLDLLQFILREGESSVLNRRLVYEKELATRVHVENVWHLDPSLFVVYAEAKPGVAPGDLERALISEVESLGQKDVGDAALQKARNMRTTAEVKSLKTNAGKAERLGMFETYLGGYARLFTVLKSYDAVTQADLRKTAARYFRADNRTVVTLVPAEGAPEEPKP